MSAIVGIFRGFPFRDDFLNIKEKERIFLLFAFVGSFTPPSSIPSSFLGHFFMPSLHKIAPKAPKSCVSRLVYFRLFAFSHAKIEQTARRGEEWKWNFFRHGSAPHSERPREVINGLGLFESAVFLFASAEEAPPSSDDCRKWKTFFCRLFLLSEAIFSIARTAIRRRPHALSLHFFRCM